MDPADLDNKITASVLTAVTECLADIDEERLDVTTIVRGIASAMIAVAYGFESVADARAIILSVVEQLDDPVMLHWVKTHTITTQ